MTYRGKLKIPEELSRRGNPLVRGEYDPNRFLAFFSRLRLEKDSVLDFVYDLQDLGGHPVVYSRDKAVEGFSSLPEFKRVFPRKYFLGSEARYNPTYLPFVRTDDTATGFLQLAMLVLTGEQFYLHWHAVYFYLVPILDQETLDSIVTIFPEASRSQARQVEWAPNVTLGPEEVLVEYVVFGEWVGLKRVSWKVRRGFPHEFLGVKEQVLVKYNNPLRF
jgi:hypothetical protein